MKIYTLFKKPDKKNLIFFVSFLVISTLVFFGTKYFSVNLSSFGIVVFVIVLSILSLITWFMAGVAVFRSLFLVGASLTLLIFLAQSYCGVPNTTQSASDALKSLFGFGLLYIGFIFLRSLYNELSKSLKHLEDVYNGKKPWIIVVLFASFTGLFMWQLYQVISPIIFNLCIYKI